MNPYYLHQRVDTIYFCLPLSIGDGYIYTMDHHPFMTMKTSTICSHLYLVIVLFIQLNFTQSWRIFLMNHIINPTILRKDIIPVNLVVLLILHSPRHNLNPSRLSRLTHTIYPNVGLIII